MRVLNPDGTLKEVRTHNATITPLRRTKKRVKMNVRATNTNIKVLNTHKV